MNVVKKINENNKTIIHLKYYGNEDWATSYFIQSLFDFEDLIKNHFKSKTKIIVNSLDDYIDALFILNVHKYDSTLVKSEYKDKLEKILYFFSNITLEKRSMSMFLKSDYQNILKREYEELYIKHDVIDITISLLLEYHSKSDEIIKYLIKEFPTKIMYNFSAFKKIFNSNLIYYELILEDTELEKYFLTHVESYYEIFFALKEKNFELYNKKIKLVVDLMRDKCLNKEINEVIQYYHFYEKFIGFLKKLNDPFYNILKPSLEDERKKLDQYILSNGTKFEYEINISEFMNVLKDESLNYNLRILRLTHMQPDDSKAPMSYIKNTYENHERELTDDISTSSEPTDDIFTVSFKRSLDILMQHYIFFINKIVFNKDEIKRFILLQFNNWLAYLKFNDISYNENEVLFDFNMLLQFLCEMVEQNNLKNSDLVKQCMYKVQTCLCGLIEKMMRTIYLKQNLGSKFINENAITLSNSIKDLSTIFDDIDLDFLEYIFLPRNGVGKNIRNIFAHYKEEIYENLSYENINISLFCLMLINNHLLLKRVKKDE